VKGIDVGDDVIFTLTFLSTMEDKAYSSDFCYAVRQNCRLGDVLMTEDRGSIAGVGFSDCNIPSFLII
jgi:hypothetical protein